MFSVVKHKRKTLRLWNFGKYYDLHKISEVTPGKIPQGTSEEIQEKTAGEILNGITWGIFENRRISE